MTKLHTIPEETKLELDQGMIVSVPTREYYSECDCWDEECFDCLGTHKSFRQRVISNVGVTTPTNTLSDYFIALHSEYSNLVKPLVVRIPCIFDPLADRNSYREHQLASDTLAVQHYGSLEVLTLLTRHIDQESFLEFTDLITKKLLDRTLIGVFDWHLALPDSAQWQTFVNNNIEKTRESSLRWAQCTYLTDNFCLPLLPENFVPSNILELKAFASSMSEQDDAQNAIGMYQRATGDNYQERAIEYVKKVLISGEFEEDYPSFDIAYFNSSLSFNIEAGGESGRVQTFKGLPDLNRESYKIVPEELKSCDASLVKRFIFV
jgi:hypothetical protein